LYVAALGARRCWAHRRLIRHTQPSRRRRKGLGILDLAAQLPHGREESQAGIEVVGMELVQVAEGNREWHLITQADSYPWDKRRADRREALDVHPARSQQSPGADLALAGMAAKIRDDQHPEWHFAIRSWPLLVRLPEEEVHPDSSALLITHGLPPARR